MNQVEQYDRIGVGYTKYRRADPRLVDAILNALRRRPEGPIGGRGVGFGQRLRLALAIGLAQRE